MVTASSLDGRAVLPKAHKACSNQAPYYKEPYRPGAMIWFTRSEEFRAVVLIEAIRRTNLFEKCVITKIARPTGVGLRCSLTK
ncbi:MAG: hypothetical protein P4N59_10685 [Negativicutes bacterium]|nr:hypothetical protein [Negativicutes bacterium]